MADANATTRRSRAKPSTEKRARLRARVYERDNYTCWLCGEKVDLTVSPSAKTAATLDHVIRVSDGGRWTMNNLRTAHRSCNAEREPHVHVVDFDEWPR